MLTKEDRDALGERFGFDEFMDIHIAPRFNIAPTQNVPVVLFDSGKRRLEIMRWGLIPSWVKDLKTMKPMVNARSETLAEKPYYKGTLKRRRCLIPADGFYEWVVDEKKRKSPRLIRLTGNRLFAFAGLWDEWLSPDGEQIRTCTIITTSANDVISPIHDRMPVILRPSREAVWLETEVKGGEDIELLSRELCPYPDEEFEIKAVSSFVNSAKVDSPQCIAEADSDDSSDMSESSDSSNLDNSSNGVTQLSLFDN